MLWYWQELNFFRVAWLIRGFSYNTIPFSKRWSTVSTLVILLYFSSPPPFFLLHILIPFLQCWYFETLPGTAKEDPVNNKITRPIPIPLATESVALSLSLSRLNGYHVWTKNIRKWVVPNTKWEKDRHSSCILLLLMWIIVASTFQIVTLEVWNSYFNLFSWVHVCCVLWFVIIKYVRKCEST